MQRRRFLGSTSPGIRDAALLYRGNTFFVLLSGANQAVPSVPACWTGPREVSSRAMQSQKVRGEGGRKGGSKRGRGE